MKKKGVILFTHGSKRKKSNQVFENLVEEIDLDDIRETRHAYLEFAEPDLQTAAEDMISNNINSIIVVPLFLFPGKHVKEDLPNIIEKLKKENDEVEFTVTDVLACNPKFKELIEEKIKQGVRSH